jgi:hypothetical protein
MRRTGSPMAAGPCPPGVVGDQRRRRFGVRMRTAANSPAIATITSRHELVLRWPSPARTSVLGRVASGVAVSLRLLPVGAAEGGADEGAADDGGADEGGADEGAAEDGGAEDGGADDGAAEDGAAEDGAAEDGGAEDGGAEDGGAEDGGAEDGGAEDGGAEDGGAEDGGAEDGGAEDGGAEDGGAEDWSSWQPAEFVRPPFQPSASVGVAISPSTPPWLVVNADVTTRLYGIDWPATAPEMSTFTWLFSTFPAGLASLPSFAVRYTIKYEPAGTGTPPAVAVISMAPLIPVKLLLAEQVMTLAAWIVYVAPPGTDLSPLFGRKSGLPGPPAAKTPFVAPIAAAASIATTVTQPMTRYPVTRDRADPLARIRSSSPVSAAGASRALPPRPLAGGLHKKRRRMPPGTTAWPIVLGLTTPLVLP